MTSQIQKVIIVGAGGHLGPSILSALDTDPHFTVSILARQSSQSVFPSHLKIHRIGDEYPEAELLEAFEGQDAVISSVATASVGIQKRLIDAAVEMGVKRFVPSEFGGDTRNEKAVGVFPQYFKGKVDIVAYLKENGKVNEGFVWTAFVTGPHFDLAMTIGYMGINLKEQKAIIYDDGNVVWSTTTYATIGHAVKNAMRTPETANKYIFIKSFTISQNQVLESCEKISGKKWDVTHVAAEEQKKIGQRKVANGDLSGAMLLIRYINCVEGYGGNFAQYEKTSNELLSLPVETLDDVVAGIFRNVVV